MPGAVIAEVLAMAIGETVTYLAAHTIENVVEKNRRERTLAAADLIVLAAHHDQRVTVAEREEVAARCVGLLGNANVEIDSAALLVRWEDERLSLASDEAFEVKVRELADDLKNKDKAKVLEAVEAVLTADTGSVADLDASVEGLQGDALTLFRRVLAD